MIRPLTIATCLLACGSGLYLYQSKHQVELLDRTIERTVHETTALREQSRLLAAEWTMLNDPERLQQFSDTYLNLKPIAPPQFTSLADLDSRLPAAQPEPPSSHGSDEPDPAPVVSENTPLGASDSTPTSGGAVVANDVLPVPPIPAPPSTPAIAPARPADTRTADRAPVSRPIAADGQFHPVVVADARPSDQRPSDQRPSDQHQFAQRATPRIADARMTVAPPPRPIVLAARRPLPVNAPVNVPYTQYRPPTVAAPVPYGGSLLGMARGSMPPAPRPTPVNAAYNAN